MRLCTALPCFALQALRQKNGIYLPDDVWEKHKSELESAKIQQQELQAT